MEIKQEYVLVLGSEGDWLFRIYLCLLFSFFFPVHGQFLGSLLKVTMSIDVVLLQILIQFNILLVKK